ncbi:SH3 domain-containing protein [Bacillus sp. EB106-08-02-XG196]|uniref:glycosyl hydrolase family 18 protein n=1 Tax=Bacillus sp. EB106-08-02-XG196 TaxID=2737049 RepID=UPI0015C43025|nr:glycosyl hydrolase family 18 protein [Bacillus sp. EB106-08-02-XG196]NWQ43782.1 SH3 domain-containing protein [Bacillus sp. EB106-08-02-XG196]
MEQIEYRKKKSLSPKWILGGLMIAILMIASPILFLLYPFASKERLTYFTEKNPILFEGTQKGNALLEGNSIFLPLTFMQEHIDHSIIFDEKSKSIIITTTDKVIQMPTDSLTFFVNQKPVDLQVSPIISKEGQIFVAIDPLLSYYPIQYTVLEDTGAVWVQKDGDHYIQGEITSEDVHPEKLRLRTEPSLQSPYTAEMSKQEIVMIESEEQDYYLVRKENGLSGYIHKKYVKRNKEVTITISQKNEALEIPKINGPIQLTWEAVYTKNPDHTLIPDMLGLNVVSPTWFSLTGNDGSIKNLASLEYSKWAQSRGYQVWGLFSNSFDPVLTHEALKDFETRQKIIVQLLHFSQMYQLQGINFDIENVKQEDGHLVTQFMREATPYLHEAGLVVSMDITFYAGENNNWSSFYERSKLASIVDYLIIMAYDEHSGSSPVSGSVSSLPWVEKNLQNLLTEVPKEKLILGVPLYTRLWKEQQNADGTKEVSSQALSMMKVKEWLAEKGLQPVYDEESGQNYVEYYAEDEKATYKVWMEDELSLSKRANLASTYQLAGVASWSRNFGDQTAWTAINMDPNKALTQK